MALLRHKKLSTDAFCFRKIRALANYKKESILLLERSSMNDRRPFKVCCGTMTTGDTCRQCGRSMSDLPPLDLGGETDPPPATTLESQTISKLPSMREELRLLTGALANVTKKAWAFVKGLRYWRTYLGHLLDKCHSPEFRPPNRRSR